MAYINYFVGKSAGWSMMKANEMKRSKNLLRNVEQKSFFADIVVTVSTSLSLFPASLHSFWILSPHYNAA